MWKNSHWIVQNFIVALLPFLISAMMIFFICKGLSWNMVDPGLYSFSMAVLSVALLTEFSTRKQTDKEFCSTVTIFYVIFILVFLSIFTYVTILKTQNEKYINIIFDSISQVPLSTQIGQLNVYNNYITLRTETLISMDFVRIFPILISLGLFMYSIFIKLKYPEEIEYAG